MRRAAPRSDWDSSWSTETQKYGRPLGRPYFVKICSSADFPSAPVEAAGDEIPRRLNDRDDHDQDGDHAHHDARIETLVTVAHGEIAEPACAHGPGHGG